MPSRNVYIIAIVIGFALAVQACFVSWSFFPKTLWAFSPLIVVPLLAMAVAAFVRTRTTNKTVNLTERDSTEQMSSNRTQITKRSLRAASAITLFLIPALLLCFLPLTMTGQLPMDFWPNFRTLLIVGFLVSIPLSSTLLVASYLP